MTDALASVPAGAEGTPQHWAGNQGLNLFAMCFSKARHPCRHPQRRSHHPVWSPFSPKLDRRSRGLP